MTKELKWRISLEFIKVEPKNCHFFLVLDEKEQITI